MKQTIWRAGLALSFALGVVLAALGSTTSGFPAGSTGYGAVQAAGVHFPNCRWEWDSWIILLLVYITIRLLVLAGIIIGIAFR